HFPRSRLVCVENTHNLKGGRVWPLAAIEAVAKCARKHGLLLHLDGARLFNAVVASGVSAKDDCKYFDSCWIDFSKGLGCPVGAGEANIVIFDIAATGMPRAEFLERLIPQGVRFSGLMKPTMLRGVTHLDVSAAGIEKAISAVASVLKK